MTLLKKRLLKITPLLIAFLSLWSTGFAQLTDGEDKLYGVKSTGGSTQDWGTIAPSSGTFTRITHISPTGLGWPLGDIGSEPDPISGMVYTRQTNNSSGQVDILSIKKSDGSTSWLGLGVNDLVVGFDSKGNKLIYRTSESSTNTLKSYDPAYSCEIGTQYCSGATATIGTFGGSSTSWQAGGIGAVDSYGRTAFQLRPNTTSTLYKINLDDGTETTVSISAYITTIAWDSKGQKLYGLYDSNSNGAYRVAEINTSDGSLTNVGNADTVAGMSNYVQLIAPNDQRYYIQESSSTIRAISLTDGSNLGSFSSILRIMPVGAVVMGAASSAESVTFDIADPDSKIVKMGANTVTYTGTNSSSGGVDIEAGTLKVAGSTNLGTGAVSLEGGELELSAASTITNAISSSDNDSAIDTGSNAVTISGTITGASEINKTGLGTLTLTGSHSNTGGLDINNGILVANGTGTTPVTVTSGTLQGTGTIGNLTSNSTVNPGNSIGTLNVSGAVTLNSGSVLVIEVDTAGNNDKITATGAITAGGTLRVSPASGTYTNGQTFTIITGSSVSGTFSTISVLSCSGTASATYGSTSITFALSNCGVNKNENRDTLVSYVNDVSGSATGDLSTVLTALNALTGDTYNAAVESLDFNAGNSIAFSNQQQIASVNNIVRQNLVSSKGEGDTEISDDERSWISLGASGWWVRGYGGSGEQKKLDSLGINGSDYSYFGTTVGYDFGGGIGTQGVALTVQGGTNTSKNSEGKSTYTSMGISRFKSEQEDNGNRFTSNISLIFNLIDSQRDISIGAISRTAKASYNAYSLDYSADYDYQPTEVYGASNALSLHSGITAGYQDGFTETGANSLNLTVKGASNLVARAGVSNTISWGDKNDNLNSVIPFVSAGIHTSYNIIKPEVEQSLSGQATTFKTNADRRLNGYAELGFGLTYKSSYSSEIAFLTKGKASDRGSEYSATLEYKRLF